LGRSGDVSSVLKRVEPVKSGELKDSTGTDGRGAWVLQDFRCRAAIHPADSGGKKTAQRCEETTARDCGFEVKLSFPRP